MAVPRPAFNSVTGTRARVAERTPEPEIEFETEAELVRDVELAAGCEAGASGLECLVRCSSSPAKLPSAESGATALRLMGGGYRDGQSVHECKMHELRRDFPEQVLCGFSIQGGNREMPACRTARGLPFSPVGRILLLRAGFGPEEGELVGVVVDQLRCRDTGAVAALEAVVEQDGTAAGA